jgi:hypothetical protein
MSIFRTRTSVIGQFSRATRNVRPLLVAVAMIAPLSLLVLHLWSTTPSVPRGTPEKRPMRDTSKAANGIRQDKVVITHYCTQRQWKTLPADRNFGYSVGTWAEDMAPQGCDQSADPAAGMRGRR